MDTPPPRVFLEKRLQGIENKGQGCEISRKEALTPWKRRSKVIRS